MRTSRLRMLETKSSIMRSKWITFFYNISNGNQPGQSQLKDLSRSSRAEFLLSTKIKQESQSANFLALFAYDK